MRLGAAAVKPHTWEDVRSALESAGVSVVPEIRIETVVDDAPVEAVVRARAGEQDTDTLWPNAVTTDLP